jgi:hypothetical protein
MEVPKRVPAKKSECSFELNGYELSCAFYSGNINDYQDHFPEEFVELGQTEDQIYGLVYPSDNVIFSSNASHFRLEQAVKSVGKETGEPVAQFQCMKKNCIPSYWGIPDSIRFDSIFLGVWDLNNLHKVGGFLGIDREWERQARVDMWKDSKNHFTEQVKTKTEEVEQRSWEGLFSWATQVVVYDGTKVIISGSLVSIALNSVISTERELAKKGTLNPKESFALVYDPVADKLVPGKGHSEAHGNLGYTNDHVLLINNYNDDFLKRVAFYKHPTIRIWSLFEKRRSDLQKLASFLSREGFSPDTDIEYKLVREEGSEEIIKTTLKEVLESKVLE